MFDWNGNGREDWGDRYIDYQIYNDIYHGDDEEPAGSQPGGGDGAGCGCLLPVIVVALVFFIWNIIFN